VDIKARGSVLKRATKKVMVELPAGEIETKISGFSSRY
jgi:hypothetical protein